MRPTEIKWNPDERKLLDYLQQRIRRKTSGGLKKVKSDNAIAAHDTEIIIDLAWDDKRFFRAKNKLRDAGVIECFTDNNGKQLVQVLWLESPGSGRSKRYIMRTIPMACAKAVADLVKNYEQEKERPKVLRENRLYPPAHNSAHPGPAKLPSRTPQQLAEAQNDAMRRLGVRPAPKRLPIHPPLKRL